jgi:hypothetical protein
VQFGPEAARLPAVVILVRIRVQERRRGPLAGFEGPLAAVGVEGREVDGVALEGDDGAVARSGLLAVDAALLQDEVAVAVVALGRAAALGEVDDRAGGVPPVLEEDAEKRVARALAVVEGDAVVEGRELALADDVGDEVGADLGEKLAQVPKLAGIT